MSSTIEFRRVVLEARIPSAHYPFSDPLYFGFAECGDSNLIEYGSNRIARSWSLVYLDRDYEFMKRVVEGAASCESGILRLPGSRRTKPESYIANWRKTMAEPILLSDYLRFSTLSLQFTSWERRLSKAIITQRERGNSHVVDRLEDLMSRLAAAPYVKEETAKLCGDEYPVTAVTVTQENCDSVIELMHRVLREGLDDWRVWRSEFSEWAWSRAQPVAQSVRQAQF